MKASKLAEYDQPVLAAAVKLAQRKQLVGEAGGWKEWLAAQPDNNILSDPRRHSSERLAAFLASLTGQLPNPRCPERDPINPKKLLKRLLPWLQKCLQEDKALDKALAKPASSAAAASSPVQAGIASLIQRTRSHPRYKQKYDFPSYEKGWLRTDRLPLPAPSAPPVLLGLDCEMCVSAASDKELLQVALVDSSGHTLLKELVKPSCEVLDYKTELTGITADQLAGVKADRQAVAARIQALLKPGTVLVGHSLHFDLAALQLDHQPLIDTAMLFTYQGLANATPSLAHLAEQLLGRSLRSAAAGDAAGQQQQQQQQQPHDSVEDASAALALVQLELQRMSKGEGPSPPLTPPAVKVGTEDQSKLCVHKLPQSTTAAAVQASFAAACRKAAAAGTAAAAAVEGASVDESGSVGSSRRQLLLVFEHPGQAVDAFATLPGNTFTDSMGRHSKRLQLLGTNQQVVVRKMSCHNGLAYGKDKAKDRGAKKGGKRSSKAGVKKPPPGKTQQGRITKKQKKK